MGAVVAIAVVAFVVVKVIDCALVVVCRRALRLLVESFELFGLCVFKLWRVGSGCASCFCVRVGLVFRLCVLQICY